MLYSNTHRAPTAETFLSFFWRALRTGLSAASPRFAAGFPLQSLTHPCALVLMPKAVRIPHAVAGTTGVTRLPVALVVSDFSRLYKVSRECRILYIVYLDIVSNSND